MWWCEVFLIQVWSKSKVNYGMSGLVLFHPAASPHITSPSVSCFSDSSYHIIFFHMQRMTSNAKTHNTRDHDPLSLRPPASVAFGINKPIMHRVTCTTVVFSWSQCSLFAPCLQTWSCWMPVARSSTAVSRSTTPGSRRTRSALTRESTGLPRLSNKQVSCASSLYWIGLVSKIFRWEKTLRKWY